MPDDQTPKGTDEITPEIQKPEEQQPPAPAVDYEKKFADSTRENQLLRERLDAEEKARQELTKDPTDSDYRAAFPDWDLLDENQKADKRRILNAERTASRAVQIAQDLQSKESWNTSLELAIASNTALQGKEDSFKKFASKPQYRNVPIELLVSSFLGTAPAPAPTPTPTAPKPTLLTGNGGPRTPEKPKTLSGDELSALRKSDYPAYEKYIKTHSIEVDLG